MARRITAATMTITSVYRKTLPAATGGTLLQVGRVVGMYLLSDWAWVGMKVLHTDGTTAALLLWLVQGNRWPKPRALFAKDQACCGWGSDVYC